MSSLRIKLLLILTIFFSAIISAQATTFIPVGTQTDDGKGTVFCVYDTTKGETANNCRTEGSGDAGLIMSNTDLANYDSHNLGGQWSSDHRKFVGRTAQSFDNGLTNTQAIIQAFPNDNSTNNAAYLCTKYGKSEDNWYLPSKNELNKMYLYSKANNLIGRNCTGAKNGMQCLIGGGDNMWCAHYWSSSESAGYSDEACRQDFVSGGQDCYSVVYCFGVRACRAFNYSTIYLFANSSAVQEQKAAEELKQKQFDETVKQTASFNALRLKIDDVGSRIDGIVAQQNARLDAAAVQQKEVFKKIDAKFDDVVKQQNARFDVFAVDFAAQQKNLTNLFMGIMHKLNDVE